MTCPFRRARRRVGELSAALDSVQGENLPNVPAVGHTGKREALAAAGISKSEAHRCEQIAAMRVRAERRMGELIEREQQAGRLAKVGDFHGNGSVSTAATHQTLSDIGIPRDRSARAC